MNKKGFTLLELMIVIIILGILATIAITQYTRQVEKSRGAEFRSIAGDIRTQCAVIFQETASTATCPAIIGAAPGMALPTPAAFANTHYFGYAVTAASPSITITATRCTGAGACRTPASAALLGGTTTATYTYNFDTNVGAYGAGAAVGSIW